MLIWAHWVKEMSFSALISSTIHAGGENKGLLEPSDLHI